MRKFTLRENSPTVGQTCEGCKQQFKANDEVTLIALGPGNDKEEQEKARSNRPYNAVAIPIHWDCAGDVEK